MLSNVLIQRYIIVGIFQFPALPRMKRSIAIYGKTGCKLRKNLKNW
jgi:hypothetical protein